MDIPFPSTTPRIVDSKWFNADNPCDEEAELTALEQSNQTWLSSVGQQYRVRTPLGKPNPEPMEECESEEEDGNDESDESEESHDEDEEEDVQQIYVQRRTQNDPQQQYLLVDNFSAKGDPPVSYPFPKGESATRAPTRPAVQLQPMASASDMIKPVNQREREISEHIVRSAGTSSKLEEKLRKQRSNFKAPT